MGSERQDRVGGEKFITLKDASEILELTEEQVASLVNERRLTAYQLGDDLVRLRRDQVWEYQSKTRISAELFPVDRRAQRNASVALQPTFFERVYDFFYFNDFYIICLAAVGVLLYLILSTQ